MFKRILFQVHWFVGITAGIVLAFVGATGAILSFEGEIQAWLNADVRRVEARPAVPLSPAALLAAVQAQAPDKRIVGLAVGSDPGEAARVTFAPPPGAPAGPGGRAPRGETRFVDPYSGALATGDGARGQEFFRTVRSLHRWLTAGAYGSEAIGKQVVGAATVLCVLLALSGLYLRWPRRWRNWRSWFALDFGLKGRSFLWHLHAVAGTWVLPLFLLMSLTGLYWSYEWYRNGMYALAGMEVPPPRGGPGAPNAGRGREGMPAAAPAPAIPVDLDAIWPVFVRESGAEPFATANIALPQQPGQPVEIRYVPADAAHDRAANVFAIDPAGSAVVRHERYRDKRVGEQLMASVFPLHSGAFFGVPGRVLYMLASLCMPLFAITGWMLYLDRRRKKRAANAQREAASAAAAVPAQDGRPTLLVHASQTGSAREIAWQTANALRSAGRAVDVVAAGMLTAQQLREAGSALFVVSTFGEGEPPDEARAFERRLLRTQVPLHGLQYGVLALGDRRYDTFCEFGRRLDRWLAENGAQPMFPRVEVDSGHPHALARWRDYVRTLVPDAAAEPWQQPAFDAWTLAARTLLNPGSAGGPTFHLELVPAAATTWEAGDIAVVQPANAARDVDAFARRHRLELTAAVEHADAQASLQQHLAHAVLSIDADAARSTARLLERLEPLPVREFSIASVPADGRLHLVVRQARRADGTLGIGSGWLTEHAAIGDTVRLRIRANPEFRAPLDDRPLVLIGNGTGIAGLRALLKARISAGRHRNWLVFGERASAHDAYYRDELLAWQAGGQLEHLDLAFSRDTPQRVYVQHRLREQAARLAAWVQADAVLCICGSAEGMAPDVEATLCELLGDAVLRRLVDEGRYRRDVY